VTHETFRAFKLALRAEPATLAQSRDEFRKELTDADEGIPSESHCYDGIRVNTNNSSSLPHKLTCSILTEEHFEDRTLNIVCILNPYSGTWMERAAIRVRLE
jgi:hypothetical protein